MPDLSSVEFWPATGHRHKPWVAETEVDAWVKSSRRVCELYGEALQHVSLPSRVKGLRLMPFCGSGPDVVVDAFAAADFEGARIEVPASVEDLSPLVRARLVLDAIDLVLRELAAAKGWPLESVAEATRRVSESGLHFGWEGRTVAARDRRRAARPRFWLTDDGLGRVQIELLDRASGQVTQSCAVLDAYSTVEGFARTSKSLRWLDAETLSLVNFSDAFGLSEETTVLDVQRDFQSHPRLSAELRPQRTAVSTRAPVVVVPPRARPHIVGGSGGPTNDVPRRYLSAVSWLYSHVPAEVVAWWAQSGLIELRVTYAYWGAKAGVRLRQNGHDLEATVRRPTPDPALDDDPATVAHGDFLDVLKAVQRRFKLPPPPPVPLPPQGKS